MRTNAPRGLNREKIRSKFMEGYCVEALARMFDCQSNAILQHVYDLIIPETRMKRTGKLSEREVIAIRSLSLEKGLSSPVLASAFNVSETTILGVVNGKFYRWVPGRVRGRNGDVVDIPENFFVERRTQTKGVRKSGPNSRSKRLVPAGALIPIAKKYGVATCTISRWIRKNPPKINLKKELKDE